MTAETCIQFPSVGVMVDEWRANSELMAYITLHHCWLYHFVGNRTFRHFDVSPPGRFATWTNRPLDVSPTWTFRPPNSSNHWKLSGKVFCYILWLSNGVISENMAKRLWGESSRGRNDQDWGEMTRTGVKRPGGETSKWWNVHKSSVSPLHKSTLATLLCWHHTFTVFGNGTLLRAVVQRKRWSPWYCIVQHVQFRPNMLPDLQLPSGATRSRLGQLFIPLPGMRKREREKLIMLIVNTRLFTLQVDCVYTFALVLHYN